MWMIIDTTHTHTHTQTLRADKSNEIDTRIKKAKTHHLERQILQKGYNNLNFINELTKTLPKLKVIPRVSSLSIDRHIYNNNNNSCDLPFAWNKPVKLNDGTPYFTYLHNSSRFASFTPSPLSLSLISSPYTLSPLSLSLSFSNSLTLCLTKIFYELIERIGSRG